MCMSCGCGKPNDAHGNSDHITLDQMQRAATAAGIDVEQAADNIHQAARQERAKDRARQPASGVASASGTAGTSNKQNVAGGNYATGDMLGTTSAAPDAGTVTGATPSTYDGTLPGAEGQPADSDLGIVTS